jgi:hypothetical protein
LAEQQFMTAALDISITEWRRQHEDRDDDAGDDSAVVERYGARIDQLRAEADAWRALHKPEQAQACADAVLRIEAHVLRVQRGEYRSARAAAMRRARRAAEAAA